MIKNKKINGVLSVINLWLLQASSAWAATSNTADPLDASKEFSDKMMEIVQGPVLKILAAVVLLVGIAGLLRGRHRLAVSCALAFILILFLPILLGKV